jgi:hypothetical protein
MALTIEQEITLVAAVLAVSFAWGLSSTWIPGAAYRWLAGVLQIGA